MSIRTGTLKEETTPRPPLSDLANDLLHGGISGGLAGLLAGGVGSRLAMRLAGALTPDASQFRLTEAGARPGQITLGGTLFLLIAGALMGAIAGPLYVSLRRHLPARWGWKRRGLAFGLILFLVNGGLVIEGDNFDFRTFGPVLLNLATFTSLFLWYCLICAFVADRLSGLDALRIEQTGLHLLIVAPAALVYSLAFLDLAGGILGRTQTLTDHRGQLGLLMASLLLGATGLVLPSGRGRALLGSGLAVLCLVGLGLRLQAFGQIL